jgi:regulator of cell morphogenesis and NO signaling
VKRAGDIYYNKLFFKSLSVQYFLSLSSLSYSNNMALITTDMKLSEVILQHYVLMPVIRRFGIHLGFGEKTILKICQEYSLDADLVASILNLYVHPTYTPDLTLSPSQLVATVSYLKHTNTLIHESQLPNVERHLQALVHYSFAKNKALGLITNFFTEIKTELQQRIEHDNDKRFPAILALADHTVSSAILQVIQQETTFHEHQESLDEKIFDLRSLLMKYLTGEADENLCYAVFFALYTLENDIRQYNNVCHALLTPAVKAMTKQHDAHQ